MGELVYTAFTSDLLRVQAMHEAGQIAVGAAEEIAADETDRIAKTEGQLPYGEVIAEGTGPWS